MKTIYKRHWKKTPTCNKQIKKNGERWMLYNEKGATVWGRVEVI